MCAAVLIYGMMHMEILQRRQFRDWGAMTHVSTNKRVLRSST